MSKWKRNTFKGKVKYYKKDEDLSDPEEEVLLDELLGNGEESFTAHGSKQTS